jgi:hypothetical protein
MNEQGSRRKFTAILVYIEDAQKAEADADGRARYPELAAIPPNGRHISPSIRDALAFRKAHYPQFKTWIEKERNTP